jgi:hypothetical protein
MEDLRLQKIAYACHKGNAKQRGIEFKLSFDEWWSIWKPHYHNRGKNVGQFVMCRKMDKGAYEVGNVTIGTVQDNANTRAVVSQGKKIKEVQQAWKGFVDIDREDESNGWLPKELMNPYRSSFA